MQQKSPLSHNTVLLLAVIATGTAIALSMCNTGCVTLNPEADPVVVRAEQTTAISFEFIDSFLQWEKANQAVVDADVHSQAEWLRKNAPAWFLTARTLTKTYKQNRTPQNKANLLTALAVLEAAQSIAVDMLSKKAHP